MKPCGRKRWIICEGFVQSGEIWKGMAGNTDSLVVSSDIDNTKSGG